MIPYAPKTDQQINNEKLVPVGKHKFEVMKCEDKTSKSGNAMTIVTLKVKNGNKNVIFSDFIMEGDEEKVKDFAYSIGLSQQYEEGFFDNLQTIGKAGMADIIVQESKNPEYPNAANRIKKYIRLKDGEETIVADNSIDDIDSIPF